MDATQFDRLARSFVSTTSRRGVARALSGFGLTGVLVPHLSFDELDAKGNKKKRRRRKKRKRQKKTNQPFCAGKNVCVEGFEATRCDDGSEGSACNCFVTAETGDPTCAGSIRGAVPCSSCSAEEVCVDLSECGDPTPPTGCGLPCPNPL